jgi:hypothetical protein
MKNEKTKKISEGLAQSLAQLSLSQYFEAFCKRKPAVVVVASCHADLKL